jgi:hypothetical protein
MAKPVGECALSGRRLTASAPRAGANPPAGSCRRCRTPFSQRVPADRISRHLDGGHVVIGGIVKKFVAVPVLLGAVAAQAAYAHFKLHEPASWLVEDDKGDPQKLAPCGGTLANPGMPTGAVTAVRGGQKLKIVVEETVFHPGHYRIALARKRNFLPPDPAVAMHDTERGPRSQSAKIEANPQPPLLADGLWPHTEKPTANWQTEITIPNITCEGCQLQIIEFMAEHPGVREGGFSYHHCAVLNITADPSKPAEDARWK